MAKKPVQKKSAGWKSRLIEAAKDAQKNAYCPYSHYPVGAAVMTESGAIYTGCNVENASYGLAICAERVAIFKAVSAGEKKVMALAVSAKSAKPCGACRQVIIEFAPKDAPVFYVDWHPKAKTAKITGTRAGRLLPQAFDPSEAGL
ncbi:MAG: cytidine deaminase [Elusimicrobia bacterium GWA2_64_40]|nr:MAG: cytidine deaminase [Elusimicrobia bacterium GWA2_64_40]OGR67518.1 MAG: cytidine deaminase [Elusimicrobia bacterium GWB2_63_16]HAN05679.1 cytidine deaminase [Elusimicrobiota bacterium]